MKTNKRKAIFISGIIAVLALAALAAIYSNRTVFKGSFGGLSDIGKKIQEQIDQALVEYEKLSPAYNGIKATQYLESIDFNLRANIGKIEGANRSFSRRQIPNVANWITILKFESNLKQVMGDDVCVHSRGLVDKVPDGCTWMPVNPARGELGKSFGRYVIFNFDTEGKPSILRGTVTIRQSPFRSDPVGKSTVEIFTVPRGGTRWDWQASCEKQENEIQKDCNFTLPEGYQVGQVVVARGRRIVTMGTPFVYDIQIEHVKIPDPEVLVFSKTMNGKWTSRPGRPGEQPRDDEIRTATIIGRDGKVYTKIIGQQKCLEDGQPTEKLEDVTRGKSRNEVEYIAGQIQKATGENFLGAVEELMEGRKAAGKDIGMCDHSARCKKAQDLLRDRAGLDFSAKQDPIFGKKRAGGFGKTADPRLMSGGTGFGGEGNTEEADRDAKEQIAQLRQEKVNNDPRVQAAREREREANQNLEKNPPPIGGKLANARIAQEKAQEKFNKQPGPTNLEKLNQAKAETEKLKTEKEAAEKAHKEAAEKADKAAKEREEAEKQAAANKTSCAPDDDKCLDKALAADLEKRLAQMNKFLPEYARLKKTHDILRRQRKDPFKPDDKLINPKRDDSGAPLRSKKPKKLDACFIMETSPAVNPGPDYIPREQCGFDCPAQEIAVGKQCEQEGEPPVQSSPAAVCANRNTFPGQQGAIDCPDDNPNCGQGIFPRRGGGGGGGEGGGCTPGTEGCRGGGEGGGGRPGGVGEGTGR